MNDQPILDDELGPCDICGGDGRWLRNGGCICDTCKDALIELKCPEPRL